MVAEAQIYAIGTCAIGTCAIGIITILNILVALHLSRVLYKSTLFMQNKPNLCVFWAASGDCEEKQTQTNPIQTQNKANSSLSAAPQSQNKPNSNPISSGPLQKILYIFRNFQKNRNNQHFLGLYT